MQNCPIWYTLHGTDIGQHLWEVSKSSFITSLGKGCRPPLRCMLIFLGENALISSLFDSFPLFLTGNASLHSNSDKLSYPPPHPTRYLKTLYTDNCDGAETLDCTLSQTNFLTLPPSPVFENSPYRQLILINDAYSRWSTGNRGRATSTREVIEVAGSNHAIGVILNLAWGPNNFSPSMIWSWRTRSNSQTGLGAE